MRFQRSIALTEVKHGALPVDKTRYENALELLKRVASEANHRFPKYEDKLANGVSSIIGFIESREEWLKNIKRMVHDGITRVSGSLTGLKAFKGDLKEIILRGIRSSLENGLYQMQFSIANIELPKQSTRTEARYAGFARPFALSSTIRTCTKLGEFLDSIGINRMEFTEAVETLRDFLLPENDATVNATKERLIAMSAAIASAYIDFHLAAQPAAEGIHIK